MKYRYTLYRPDGSSTEIGEYKKTLEFRNVFSRKENKEIKGMYSWLECSTIEIIPRDYYPDADMQNENVTYFGDKEARLVSEPEQNRHMKVLFDHTGGIWDVVGNLVREEKISERTSKSK